MEPTPETFTSLLTRRSGSVLEITLNRPEVHNAFDDTLIQEITRCVTEASMQGATRALVLRGAGPSFCAGADLKWMARAANYSYEQNLDDARTLQRMFAALAHFPGVTVAVIQGAAIGGGAGLVAVCDIAIAVGEVKFALSEVRLGLVPAVIAPYVLTKIGAGAARALFVTGERFGASDALRMGLIQEAASDAGEAEQLLNKKLRQILEAGPQAILTAKRLIQDLSCKNPDEAAELTAECIARLRVSDEGQEGIHAFLEKRKPHFAESLTEDYPELRRIEDAGTT